MIAFLLDTKLGHLLIGVLCMVLVGAGMYWRGHNKGFDAATAHYSAVVNSCLSANTTLADTTKQLQAANAQWADAAKVDAAKVAQAEAQAKATQAAEARALAEAQAKLKRVIYASHTALVWGLTRVPTSVAGELRQ